MKYIYMLLVGVACSFSAAAQHQITNFGNIQFHAGATVTLFGDLKNNGNFTDTSSYINFKGSSLQTISGTSVTSFNNCVINNSSGVSLQQSIVAKNSIKFSQGLLQLNNKTLTVVNSLPSGIIRLAGGIVSEQTDNSGKVSWMMNSSTGAHVFPFSTASGQYIPFTFDLMNGNIGTVTLATYPTNAANLPYPSNPDVVTHVNNSLGVDNSLHTVDRFWQIDKTGAGGTADITFTATNTEVGTITNLNAYRWNSSSQAWQNPSGAQTNTSYSVTVQGVTTFSPWTLAGDNSPLPVMLVDFSASLNTDKDVDLFWTTVSEINNDYFTIEKTMDGYNFEEVARVDGAGNSDLTLNYTTVDHDPYPGQSYYRLKQTDYDGNVKYTDLRSIFIGSDTEVSVSLYPNPNNGTFNLALTGMQDKEVSIQIMDLAGKMFYGKNLGVINDFYLYEFEEGNMLPAGIYMLQILTADQMQSIKLIVQ